MTIKANKYKQKFADFQASYDDQSYEINKERKQELFKGVSGRLLEIGPGTGVNFPFLSDLEIEWIGIEPNPAMHDYLFQSAERNDIQASLLECTTESICLPDEYVDFVISTEVLCSVDDLSKSLDEIRRVLRPGGKFLFLEHVVDHKNPIRRVVQKTVPHTPWKCYSDGCDPGRDIGLAIEQAGFGQVQFASYMQPGKGIINLINKPHIIGWAKK